MQPLPLSKEQVDALFPRPSWDQRPFLVIWEVTRRCSLRSLHRYSSSTSSDYPGELSLEECRAVIDGLAQFKIPALLLSGGGPTGRKSFAKSSGPASRRATRPAGHKINSFP
jgi:MoaA/NifB/PqqE/SkfB family radical SAM enzyme